MQLIQKYDLPQNRFYNRLDPSVPTDSMGVEQIENIGQIWILSNLKRLGFLDQRPIFKNQHLLKK